MHPVYRQVFFGFLALISVIIAFNKCEQRKAFKKEQQQWGPTLDAQMRDVFYAQSEKLTPNETERDAYADCCLSKMKELFPNGLAGLEKGLTDSTRGMMLRMGLECSKTIQNHTNIWQPEVIQQLKLQMYSYPETKLMATAAMKKEYVDCISFKMITRFPNGIDGISNKDSLKAIMIKSRKDCLKLLVNKYQKLKQLRLKTDTTTSLK